MKAIEKRFRTLELTTYRMANAIKITHFDTEKRSC